MKRAPWPVSSRRFPSTNNSALNAFEKASFALIQLATSPIAEGQSSSEPKWSGSGFDKSQCPFTPANADSFSRSINNFHGGVVEPVMKKSIRITTRPQPEYYDVVDARFTDFILTFPLPPLVVAIRRRTTPPGYPLLANSHLSNRKTSSSPSTPRRRSVVDSPFGTSTDDQFVGQVDARRLPGMGMRMPGMGMEDGIEVDPAWAARHGNESARHGRGRWWCSLDGHMPHPL